MCFGLCVVCCVRCDFSITFAAAIARCVSTALWQTITATRGTMSGMFHFSIFTATTITTTTTSHYLRQQRLFSIEIVYERGSVCDCGDADAFASK